MERSEFDQGPPSPCPAPFNLAAHDLARADDLSAKTALCIARRDEIQTWRYGDLKQAILGTATGLLAAGLSPGDKVLMRLGNTVDFPIAYLAAIAVDLVPIPTSAALTEAEVARIIAELEPACVLHDPNVTSAAHDRVLDLPRLRDMHSLPQATFRMGDPDRLGYIVYTSGTSGQPRAVGHAHRAIWARQMMITGWYDLKESDRLMHAGAFNWTYTLGTGLMDPWTQGATAIVPASGLSTVDFPALLSQQDVSIFAAVPGVYRQILRRDLPHLPKLRHGLSAGEKLPETTRVAWQAQTGTDIHEAFGMSECSTFISGNPARPLPAGALGAPQKGRRIAIVDQGEAVPLGDVGGIAIHRSDPGLMLGYLNTTSPFEDRLHGDWFLTGDMGRMSDDGAITYEGRADDMMNAGGFRVSPLEVEACLATFPEITGVAVTEVPVASGATIIAAFYTSSSQIDETALTAHAEKGLARYKLPRAYVSVNALPTGANGKIVRRNLKQIWIEGDHGTR